MKYGDDVNEDDCESVLYKVPYSLTYKYMKIATGVKLSSVKARYRSIKPTKLKEISKLVQITCGHLQGQNHFLLGQKRSIKNKM